MGFLKRIRLESYTLPVGLTAVLLVSLQAFAVDSISRRLYVKEGVLHRGFHPYTIRAIEHQALFDGELSDDDRARAYAQASDAGFTSFKFQLKGYNKRGTEFDPETIATALRMKEEVSDYWMPPIIDVVGAYADASPAFRERAVRTAARTFNGHWSALFWIEGPDAAKLVKAFKEESPTLTVAATEGGDIDIVEKGGKPKSGRAAFVAGTLPSGPDDPIHTLLPQSEEVFAKHEEAIKRTVETAKGPAFTFGLTEEEKAGGWVSLFNGENLDGWTIMGPNKEGFVAEDGEIRWNGSGGTVLLSAKKFDDFVLKLEWRIYEKGGNAGVFLRAPRANRMSRMGFEVQMMGDYGTKPGIHTTGAIYDVLAPLATPCKPVGEWNAYEITARGPHVEVKLNDVVVQDFNMDEVDALRLRMRNGFIGLQDHQNPAAFRRIRIKEL